MFALLTASLAQPLRTANANQEPSLTTGEWLLLNPPAARSAHSAVWDPARSEMLVFAGEGGGPLGDLWSYQPSTQAWNEVKASGSAPAPLSGQTAVWDSAGSQMLIYGGYGAAAPRPLWAYRPGSNDWHPLEPDGPAPSAQGFHSAVWDPGGERMLVFGGVGPSFGLINDLWAFRPQLNRWQRLDPGGEPPPPVLLHRAVWDPDGQQMLVFGGVDPLTGRPSDELWSYLPTDNAWKRLAPELPRPPGRLSFGAVWDPVGRRFLVLGGSCGPGCFLQDVWSYRPQENAWLELPSVGERPAGRAGHSSVWEPSIGRVLLFGGSVGSAALSDLWAYRPAAYAWTRIPALVRSAFDRLARHRAVWDDTRHQMLVVDTTASRLFVYSPDEKTLSEVFPRGDPWSRRQDPSVVWDPEGQRLLMFGGFWEGRYIDDLLAFSAREERWDLILPSGPSPPGRFRHAAAWNPADKEMLVFGGYADGTSLDDVWSYRPSSNRWEQHSPQGRRPSPRSDHSVVWDAEHSRALLFGGRRGDVLADLWAYDPRGRAWETLRDGGPVPPPRFGHNAVWDPGGPRMLLVGGFGSGPADDIWSYRPAAREWQRLPSTGAPHPARGPHSTVWDPKGSRLLLLTGHTSGAPNALWSYRPESRSWSSAPALAPRPLARYGHSLIFDEHRFEALLFGGASTSTSFLNDIWMYHPETPGWRALEPGGARPFPRRDHVAVWDPTLQRMYVFGGRGQDDWLDDTWVFDALERRWMELAVTEPRPTGREEHAAVWDSSLRRMLLFGGAADGRPVDDLWSFDPINASWSRLEPSDPRPPPRHRHAAIWDSDRRSMLIFGGYGGTFPGRYLDDVWAYDSEANVWRELVPEGGRPGARARHAAAWDPRARRMLVFGGYTGGVDYLADLWQLELNANVWTRLPAGPAPRAGHRAVWHASDRSMLVFGGQRSGSYDELWLWSAHSPP